MQNRLLHCATFATAVALSVAGFATASRAQLGPGPNGIIDPGSMLKQGAAMAPKMEEKPLNRPPALPGATSRNEVAAPATRNPSDMSPNDALFDAIDRGDIAAARDALSRGAELNAQNMLGMTPMELSVDLGRNDISFLLMSYRNTDAPQGPPSARTKAAGAPGPAMKAATATPSRHANVVPAKDVVAAPQPQTPRLFANDGGAAVPSAGFLGFGSASGGR